MKLVPGRQAWAGRILSTDLLAGARIALIPFLVSRVVLVTTGGVANLLLAYGRPQDPQHPAFLEGLLGWDALHYMRVARDGYPAQAGAFDHSMFPLLPLLLRLLGASDLAGLVLCFVLGLAGLGVMAALTRAVFDQAVASRTAWVAAFWPAGLVWTAVYSEGLFLALAAGCLWAAWRQRPVLAAVLGLLAGTTRLTGAALMLPLLFLLPAGRSRLASLAPPLGALIFAAYLASLTGDPLAVFHSELGHGHAALFRPWHGLIAAAAQLRALKPDLGLQLLMLGPILALVAGLFRLERWRTPAIATVLALLGPALISGTLSSFSRYAMVAFPLFWVAQRLPTALLAGVGIPVAVVATVFMASGRMTP